MLKGKKISILGDSISTYQAVSNDPSINPSLLYNPVYYKKPFPLERTYWMQLIDRLGMTLCVNNSWSGGNLSGKDDPTSGMNRATQLSRDSGEKPDFILLFMGMNDLGRGIHPDVFLKSYSETLSIFKELYPDATVCCVNLPDRDVYLKPRCEIFNKIIESAVKDAGDKFFIADLYHSRLNNDFYYMNTTDGLHPDEDGMRIIAEIIIESINRYFAF
jgi:lysophospholipase L1-like esterase